MSDDTTKTVRVALPVGAFCYEPDVRGWTVEAQRGRVALFNRQGDEVAPNCAPGDVRDSFREFMRDRDRRAK